jgi:hypothetical protein
MNGNTTTAHIHTMLKFVKSEINDSYISFVSVDTITGRVKGVRKDSPYNKLIVVLDRSLQDKVIKNVLYEVTLIRMSSKNGYIAIEINPKKFKATIETTYVPKSIYNVDVKFGNKIIRYNPFEGVKNTVRDIESCVDVIKQRQDIANISYVVKDFIEAAKALDEKMKRDGFYYKTKKAKAS